MSVQFVEDRLLTELKHQVEASFPPEHLQQVDQIHMFQLLQAPPEHVDSEGQMYGLTKRLAVQK